MDAAPAACPLRLAAASSSSSGAEPQVIGARAIEGEAADAFSEGLMGLLTPLVHKCDEGVQAALDSQAALSQQIDRVTTCPCTRASAAAHSYAPLTCHHAARYQRLHPTRRRRRHLRPHHPTPSLRRSQPSCRRFSARLRSPPSHRTRRSCRVCAGGSRPRTARCSRYKLDWRGSTAWRSGSKQRSTARCGRFLCRSHQARMRSWTKSAMHVPHATALHGEHTVRGLKINTLFTLC